MDENKGTDDENVVTYETFTKFHRREKNNIKLQELPEDFFQACASWIKRKRKMADPESFQEMKNVKRLIEDIFDRREKKILILAMHAVRGSAIPKDLLPEEKGFFDKIVSTLQDFRNNVLQKLNEEKIVKTPELEKHEEYEKELEMEKEEKKEEEEEQTKTEVKPTYHNLVRILADIPMFMGTDLKPYGPFKSGDLATVPGPVKDLLIEKGKAEEAHVG